MTTKTSNRLPWLFFVGPDGVVRTSRDAGSSRPRALLSRPLRVESRSSFEYHAQAPGGVPEWLKGADCKSVGAAYLGSNPSSPTSLPG